jgi:hypothetical protein
MSKEYTFIPRDTDMNFLRLLRQNGMPREATVDGAGYELRFAPQPHAKCELQFTRYELGEYTHVIDVTLREAQYCSFLHYVDQAIAFVPTEETPEWKVKMADLPATTPDLDTFGGKKVEGIGIWVGRSGDKIWFAIDIEGVSNIQFEMNNLKD